MSWLPYRLMFANWSRTYCGPRGRVNLNFTLSLTMKKHVCILYEIYVQANYLYIIKAIFIWHVFIYIPNLLYILAIIFLWSKNNTDITVQSLIIYCNQCMCCQIVYFMYLWCLYVCIHMCFLFWFFVCVFLMFSCKVHCKLFFMLYLFPDMFSISL